MKKIIIGITVLTIILLLSGCGKEKTSDNNNYSEEKKLSNKIGDYSKNSENLKCDVGVLNNIKFMNDKIIITMTIRVIYTLYIYELYSNNLNCKEFFDFEEEKIQADATMFYGGKNRVFVTESFNVYDYIDFLLKPETMSMPILLSLKG